MMTESNIVDDRLYSGIIVSEGANMALWVCVCVLLQLEQWLPVTIHVV